MSVLFSAFAVIPAPEGAGVGHLYCGGVFGVVVPPSPLYKLRPCPSYSRRRDRINLVPNFNSVPNVVQPHKTWVW